jgi:hypothetical protein
MNCYIVKDLLPNYIDGLVSEETRKDVCLHLETCSECKSIYDQMLAPMDTLPPVPKKEEINFLLKIKRKTVKKVLKGVAVGLGALLIIFGVLFWVFAIGTPVKSEDVDYTTSMEMINYFKRLDPDAPKTDREWVIQFNHKNGKALRAVTEDVYSKIDEGGEIVTGRIVRLYEVQPSSLLYESSRYSTGYSAGNVALFKEPPKYDFTITIRFSDKDITYSMTEEGLFEPTP